LVNMSKLMYCKPFPSHVGPPKIESVRQSVEFLVKEVGLPPSQATKALSSCPQLLAINISRQRDKLLFLREEIGFSDDVIIKVVSRFPHILKYNVQRNMRPTLTFISTSLDFSDDEIRSVLERQPGVLQLRVDDNLHPKVFFMVQELGLRRDDLKKILLVNPMILTLSLENYIRPKMEFLKNEFDLEPMDVAKILKLHPPFLTYTQESIRNTFAYLAGFGVMQADIRRAMRHCPQIFGLRSARLQENIDFLREQVFLTPPQLTQVICSYPRILTYKVEPKIRAKLSYLTEELDLSPQELVQEILHFPQLLGYSLDKRLRNRIQHLQRCGIAVILRARKERSPGRERRKAITLKSAMTPSDSIFFSRYKEKDTLHWLAYGTIRYDPYGVEKDEEDKFSIDLTDFH